MLQEHTFVPSLTVQRKTLDNMTISEAEFIDRFKNRNLEPYARDLYRATYSIQWLKNCAQQKSDFEAKLVAHLTEAVDILYIIKDLLSGRFIHNKHIISDKNILGMVESDLETAYRMKMEFYRKDLSETMFDLSTIGEYPVFFSLFDDSGKIQSSNVAYMYDEEDENMERSLPDPPFGVPIFKGNHPADVDEYIVAVESALKLAKSKSKYDMELPVKAFLREVIKMNIPLVNKYYSELYECLELVEAIDPSIIKAHSTSSDPYNKENFMKSRFKRVRKEIEHPEDHIAINFTLHIDEENSDNNIKGF